MCLYIWLYFVYYRIFFLVLELFQSPKESKRKTILKWDLLAREVSGGGWVGGAWKCLSCHVSYCHIQIDLCPFRSTQRCYCAFDSAVVLLLRQSPLRFPVPASERSEHPETLLSKRRPHTAENAGSRLLPLCPSPVHGSSQVQSAAASGAQESDFSALLPSRTGPLYANPRPRRHNNHNEH